MRMIFRGGLAAAFLLAASIASAATVTFSKVAPGPFTSDLKPFSEEFQDPLFQVLTLPRFDPSFGVLTGVDVHAAISGNALGDFYECYQSGASCEGKSVTLQLRIQGFPATSTMVGQTIEPLTCTAAPGMPCSDPKSIALILGYSPPIAPGSVASYLGPGSFDVTFQYLPFWTTGARVFSVSASNLNASVTYTYDEHLAPVPLPAGLPLLLGGLGLFGLFRGRTRVA